MKLRTPILLAFSGKVVDLVEVLHVLIDGGRICVGCGCHEEHACPPRSDGGWPTLWTACEWVTTPVTLNGEPVDLCSHCAVLEIPRIKLGGKQRGAR